MVHDPQVENHCTKPTIQLNQADDLMILRNFLKLCQNVATLKSKQEVSVRPIHSEPFRSRDFSVVVVLVSRHFGQTMKSCRNLAC